MTFVEALNFLINTLGSTVLLPFFIFIFALILGAKVGRAFRAAVTIGVAFIGIGLVLTLMLTALGGVAQAMVEGANIQRDIFDVGWPAAAAVAFATDVGLWVLPIGLLVNVVLLATGVTKTLNVDLWNFWHYAFAGSLVTSVTGSLPMGLAAAAVAAAFMLFLGDWTAKGIQDFYELPGISIPHGATAPLVFIGLPVNWVIEQIPGLRDMEADTEAIERVLGPTAGDPMVMGLIIGVVLGLIAYLGEFAGAFIPTLGKILVLAFQLAAAMVLLPRMVRILMEGLIPVSEAARTFMSKRFAGREIYIGLDSAVLVGHPANISTGLLLVPIAILLSIILPGNRMVLFVDLAVLVFWCTQIAPAAKGNVLRMVIIGTVLLIVGFYGANALAPVTTEVAVGTGTIEVPESAVLVSSVADGFVWSPLLFMWAGQYLGWIGIGIWAVVTGVLFFLYKRNEEAWDVFAGAPGAEVAEAVAAPAAGD